MDGWMNGGTARRGVAPLGPPPLTRTHPHTSALLTHKVPKWAWLPKWTLLFLTFPPLPLRSLFVLPFCAVLGSRGFCGFAVLSWVLKFGPHLFGFLCALLLGVANHSCFLQYMVILFFFYVELIAAWLMMVIICACHHLSPWYQQMWNQVDGGECRFDEREKMDPELLLLMATTIITSRGLIGCYVALIFDGLHHSLFH